MRSINPSALLRLLLLMALCVALLPMPAAAQPTDDVVVLVDETFDNPDAGELSDTADEDSRLAYERGEYVMEGIGRQYAGQLGFWLYDVVADGTIAVDVRLRGPVRDRLVFLGCRDGGVDEIVGYSLVLDLAHGDVVLWAKNGSNEGDDVQLTDYVAHGAIRTGNRSNRLELSCLGSTITGRVNSVEVLSVTDDRFQQGSFFAGVGVYSGSSGPVEGVFDNLLVTMVATPDASARRDAREFDQLRAEAQELPSLFGPAAGEVRSDEEEFVSDRIAGVDVRDFYARATFVNPYDVDEQRWDVGIAFRNTGSDEQLRLILRSTGRWYFTDGPSWPLASGPVAEFDSTDGGENTIEVAVVEETGYLALNGEYLATFDASARMASGDIWIGAGFFPGDNVLGDRTYFHDFEVWGLGEDAAPEPSAPPEADPGRGQPRLPGPRDPDEPAEPTEEAAPEPAGEITCDDFTTQEGAQYALDITRDEAIAEALDPDGDGVACDDLPTRDDEQRNAGVRGALAAIRHANRRVIEARSTAGDRERWR